MYCLFEWRFYQELLLKYCHQINFSDLINSIGCQCMNTYQSKCILSPSVFCTVLQNYEFTEISSFLVNEYHQ